VPDNVTHFRKRRPAEQPKACPAQFYKFTGDPALALQSPAFMEKAAAFQEIRDCLIAADNDRLSIPEAERLVRYLVRTYLNGRAG
jgi:hypothetical protein